MINYSLVISDVSLVSGNIAQEHQRFVLIEGEVYS